MKATRLDGILIRNKLQITFYFEQLFLSMPLVSIFKNELLSCLYDHIVEYLYLSSCTLTSS